MHRYLVILMAVLMAAPLCAQSDLTFAQLAVGGSPAYETVLQIINEVESGNTVTIDVYKGTLSNTDNGKPLAVRFDGGTAISSKSITLAAFQELTTVLTSDGGALKNGWVRVRSTLSGGKISGNLIFRQRNGSTLVDSVGVPTPQRYRQAVIQVDQRETGSDSGIALVNPDSSAMNVVLDLFQGTTRAASTLTVTLQPNQHYAKLLSELFPSFGTRQGTLLVEAAAGRSVACMALRLDGNQLTSIPVRPLGFSMQYSVANDAGTVTETGTWVFDLAGFNLIGTGKVDSPVPGEAAEVTGSWLGTSFQFRYRKILSNGSIGMVSFNGTSAGPESTVGPDGKSKAITGKVTTIGADGQAVSTGSFSAYHKFGAPPD
jgi:hypothetical protein